MRLLAPAKINLFLSVGARRSDGLHEIVSVMQSVSLADEVTLEASDGLSLSVEPPGAAPEDESNLAVRAALAFAASHGREPNAHITLSKRIPAAAGMAGGSADAAAVLVGLNALWGAGVSRKALERIGSSLGSDVGFCVRGGTAVVSGAGEELSSLPVAAASWWVIGVPEESLSTADVYAEFDRLGEGDVEDPWEIADALARGDLERLASALRNDLEPAALSLAPSIEGGGAALREAGALGAILTGSGPAWIGLARDEEHARAVAATCGPAFARVEVARALDRGPRIVER